MCFARRLERHRPTICINFFDKDGNTLVLRPDITPSIARASATLFKDENLPIRLCYTGNTFVNHSSYQGRLRETTQMGAEFVGDDSVEADAEMLALVIESMLTIGLKEFQLCVGNVDFFQSLIEDASLDEEAEERVRELIGNRNYFGVEEFLDSIQAKRSSKEAFSALNELIGGIDILEKSGKPCAELQRCDGNQTSGEDIPHPALLRSGKNLSLLT